MKLELNLTDWPLAKGSREVLDITARADARTHPPLRFFHFPGLFGSDSMPREKNEWGTTLGTGAASVDEIVSSWPIGRDFTIGEVESEMIRRGLKKRGAIHRQLETLRDRGGYVVKGDQLGAWRRVK